MGLDGVSARPWCLESSTAEVYLGTNVVSAVTADSSGVFDVDLEIVGSQAMDKVSGCSWHFSTQSQVNKFVCVLPFLVSLPTCLDLVWI